VDGHAGRAWIGSNGPLRVKDTTTLRTAIGYNLLPSISGKPKNFKPNISFFKSLSTAEVHMCGMKFIGLSGNFGLTAI